jgi:alpha-maltose-1-phosphate synthase
MKVTLLVNGRRHTFDLARELYRHGVLQAIFSSYPWWKLRKEGLPRPFVRTFPWLHAPYMGFPGRHLLGRTVLKQWEWLSTVQLDRHVARHLPECDVLVAQSSAGLISGAVAQMRGARYVCDRPCTHIRTQDAILHAEHERWGLPFDGIDPRVIAREEEEYSRADVVTVPSTFAARGFAEQSVEPSRVHILPYGVDSQRFHPTTRPPQHSFEVLFVGAMTLQKGIPYLLEAFRRLEHPRKSLTLAGAPSPSLIAHLTRRGVWPGDVRVVGHVPQAQLKHMMSRSHVLVLPSVQDGFGLVMAEAMACGCPVIASTHTGAADLFTDGLEGFIVRVRDADALTSRMQALADDPALRDAMGRRALAKVQSIGGWSAYGNAANSLYVGLVASRPAPVTSFNRANGAATA